jgi:hypothetical protein
VLGALPGGARRPSLLLVLTEDQRVTREVQAVPVDAAGGVKGVMDPWSQVVELLVR